MAIRVGLAVDDSTSQAQIIRRAAAEAVLHDDFEIADKWTVDTRPAMIICQQTELAYLASPLARDVPIVIVERLDGAQLSGPTRRALATDQRIALVLKTAVYRDLEDYNRSLFGGFSRRQEAEIFNAMVGGQWDIHHSFWKPPTPRLSPDQLRKIVCMFGWESYPQLAEAASMAENMPADRARPIDLFFAGTIGYPGSPIGAHRVEAVRETNRIRGIAERTKSGLKVVCHAGRELDREAYLRTMADSKMVVCPYGFGETCQRDYEAMLLGCIPLKPKMDWIDEGGPLSNLCVGWMMIEPLFENLAHTVDACAGRFPPAMIHDMPSTVAERQAFYLTRRQRTRTRLFHDIWERVRSGADKVTEFEIIAAPEDLLGGGDLLDINGKTIATVVMSAPEGNPAHVSTYDPMTIETFNARVGEPWKARVKT